MCRLKKIVILLTAALLTAVTCPVAASADEDTSAFAEEMTERLSEAIDSETAEDMRSASPDGASAGTGSLDPQSLISGFKNAFVDSLKSPLKKFGSIAAVLIVSSAVQSMAAGGETASAVGTVSVLGCVTLIYSAVCEAFTGVCVFLRRLSEFMLSYIPIYASVTAASGGVKTGGSYYAAMLGVTELIGFVAERAVMPFLSVFMVLSFTAAVNPTLKLSNAAASVGSGVRITLTALMTVFGGSAAIQSISSAAADTAAARAVRFGAASFVPIIGGSVSEAYSTVCAGVGMLRSGVGTVGIAAVAFMLIRPLVTLICLRIMLGLSKVTADLLGAGAASELLSGTGYAVSAAISTVLCFGMMFILSTAVVTAAAAGIQR